MGDVPRPADGLRAKLEILDPLLNLRDLLLLVVVFKFSQNGMFFKFSFILPRTSSADVPSFEIITPHSF